MEAARPNHWDSQNRERNGTFLDAKEVEAVVVDGAMMGSGKHDQQNLTTHPRRW
jgi:hypothetical protein